MLIYLKLSGNIFLITGIFRELKPYLQGKFLKKYVAARARVCCNQERFRRQGQASNLVSHHFRVFKTHSHPGRDPTAEMPKSGAPDKRANRESIAALHKTYACGDHGPRGIIQMETRAVKKFTANAIQIIVSSRRRQVDLSTDRPNVVFYSSSLNWCLLSRLRYCVGSGPAPR